MDLKLLFRIALWTSVLGIVAIISDFGYAQSEALQQFLDGFYFVVLGIGVISTLMRDLKNYKLIKRNVFIFDVLSISFTLWVFYHFLLMINIQVCVVKTGARPPDVQLSMVTVTRIFGH